MSYTPLPVGKSAAESAEDSSPGTIPSPRPDRTKPPASDPEDGPLAEDLDGQTPQTVRPAPLLGRDIAGCSSGVGQTTLMRGDKSGSFFSVSTTVPMQKAKRCRWKAWVYGIIIFAAWFAIIFGLNWYFMIDVKDVYNNIQRMAVILPELEDEFPNEELFFRAWQACCSMTLACVLTYMTFSAWKQCQCRKYPYLMRPPAKPNETCPRWFAFFGAIFFCATLGLNIHWNYVHNQSVNLGNPHVALVFILTVSGWLGFSIGAFFAKKWRGLFWFFFLTNLTVWPVVMRFTLVAPVAGAKWYDNYDPFPLNNAAYMKDFPQGDKARSIAISAVPTKSQMCNFSCKKGPGEGAQARMSYHVTLGLSKGDIFKKSNSRVLYPVLLMSSNFRDWHVAADRNSASPKPFFRSFSDEEGMGYLAVVPSGLQLFEDRSRNGTSERGPAGNLHSEVDVTDPFISIIGGAYYLLACVVTTDTRLEALRADLIDPSEKNYSSADLASKCDYLGGSCGYPCGQEYANREKALHCNANGSIDVSSLFGKTYVPQVSVSRCEGDPTIIEEDQHAATSACTSSPLPMSEWTCPGVGLPSFEISARGIPQVSSRQHKPTTFMFAATARDLKNGVWKPYSRFSQIRNTTQVGNTVVRTSKIPRGYPLGYPMALFEDNQLVMKPDLCMGVAGPTYMVACAINQSAYDFGGSVEFEGEFKSGQSVAPPPLNDRCVAVSGVCGQACQQWNGAFTNIAPIQKYCNADGTIPQWYLVNDIEMQTNEGFLVRCMVFVLLLGYYQRVLAGVPGLFHPYKQAPYYVPSMTQDFKYIATCTPSAGEDKMCTLRNIIGTTAAYPSDCHDDCCYHVVLLDEGHRTVMKSMFQSYVLSIKGVMEKIQQYTKNDREAREQFHEFMTEYCRTTRSLRLEDCLDQDVIGTDTFYKAHKDRRQNLLKSSKEAWTDADKKFMDICEKMLDSVCGKTALKLVYEKYKGKKMNDDQVPIEVIQLRGKLDSGVDKSAGKDLKEQDDVAVFDASVMGFPLRQQYRFHYIARAKVLNAEVKATQHVTVGIRYYTFDPKKQRRVVMDLDDAVLHDGLKAGWLSEWLALRSQSTLMMVHKRSEIDDALLKVPMTTSRGKAGGLNFVANYLYLYHLDLDTQKTAGEQIVPDKRPALFSIADARHQYQPDFMVCCIPYFFKDAPALTPKFERDAEVAFTQVPQNFPDIQDETDFLDNNNSMYFRINGAIRNCCGGVSSCGANGTWQLNDPRNDHLKYGLEKHYLDEYLKHRSSQIKRVNLKEEEVIAEAESSQYDFRHVFEVADNNHIDTATERDELLGDGKQLQERTVFHESCKIEDTASSLVAILRGQRSQYVNMRLSYAMTKAPMSYLGAVNRWAEGAVVLGIQTYVDMPIHTRKPWASKTANIIVLLVPISFICWTIYYVYGFESDFMANLAKSSCSDNSDTCWQARLRDYLFGGKDASPFHSEKKGLMQDFANSYLIDFFGGHHPVVPAGNAKALFMMFISLVFWSVGLIVIVLLVLSTTVIYNGLNPFCKWSKKRIKGGEVDTSPSWPIEVAAWARLAIIMDNLTYWLFFWTAFFWIGFNSYTAFFDFSVGYHANYVFLVLVLLTSSLHYGQLAVAMTRATNIQRDEANNILGVTLDNIWRQTQLYYINAPLQAFAILNGIKDYMAQKSYGIDLSFWVGGDRGDMTTKVVKFWLLTMISIAIAAVFWNIVRTDASVTSWVSTVILVLSALDVAFPAAYLCCSTCKDSYAKMAKERAAARRKRKEGQEETPSSWYSRCYACVCHNAFFVGTDKELPMYARPLTASWYGKKIYWFFCEFSAVVGIMKYAAVGKEFLVPAGLATMTALSALDAGDNGMGISTQLVASGFTGAH